MIIDGFKDITLSCKNASYATHDACIDDQVILSANSADPFS